MERDHTLERRQQVAGKGGSGSPSKMVSRRVVEEMARAQGEEWYRFTFFDIEKAYPRACRGALWE
eukprot:5330727-Lingulodinium_polyedra.AAC.1